MILLVLLMMMMMTATLPWMLSSWLFCFSISVPMLTAMLERLPRMLKMIEADIKTKYTSAVMMFTKLLVML